MASCRWALFAPPADAGLTELVPLLVVTDEGDVVPLTYDLGAEHHWGSLHDAGLATLAGRWRPEGAPRLAAALARAHAAMAAPGGPPMLFWYDVLGASRDPAA
jgi:hypothetical protein